jgi:cytoskeletal protein CcmA (bactofilin family)
MTMTSLHERFRVTGKGKALRNSKVQVRYMLFSRKKKSGPPPRGPQKTVTAEPSFIGRNCVFEGHITCDGEMHIDGTVRGTVQAAVCVIDEAGVIHGSVSGDVIHVRGRVLGPIQGSNVFIHAGAHVEGEVFHDTISIENGAYVYGSIRHNAAPPPVSLSKRDDLLPPLSLNGESQNGLRVVINRK